MARFITVGYGDEAGYAATAEAVRAAAHRRDDQLVAEGAVMGIAGAPVRVTNHGGTDVSVREGSFLTAELPVAGFGLIEADSIEQAAEKVAGTPCAVAYGVVEVWPLETGNVDEPGGDAT